MTLVRNAEQAAHVCFYRQCASRSAKRKRGPGCRTWGGAEGGSAQGCRVTGAPGRARPAWSRLRSRFLPPFPAPAGIVTPLTPAVLGSPSPARQSSRNWSSLKQRRKSVGPSVKSKDARGGDPAVALQRLLPSPSTSGTWHEQSFPAKEPLSLGLELPKVRTRLVRGGKRSERGGTEGRAGSRACSSARARNASLERRPGPGTPPAYLAGVHHG